MRTNHIQAVLQVLSRQSGGGAEPLLDNEESEVCKCLRITSQASNGSWHVADLSDRQLKPKTTSKAAWHHLSHLMEEGHLSWPKKP